MNNLYFVSAYATSPSTQQWNSKLESNYFQLLEQKKEIIGIEHPFLMQSEKYPLDWLTENIPSHWSIIITLLPLFMNMAKTNSAFGLASINEKERSVAVKVMQQTSDYVHRLNQKFCRKIVKAIHFHSLPSNKDNNINGNKAALKKSLAEIKNIDWGETNLNLEHCDAYIPNQAPDKGFLLLKDEIEVLCEIGGYGMVLNWARSAIEGRCALTPLTHIKMTKKAGLLKGFFFSGCGNNIQSEYGYWKDTHMPPKKIIERPSLNNDSLLGQEEIHQALNLLNTSIHYLGVKVSNPNVNKNFQKAANINIDTIDALEKSN